MTDKDIIKALECCGKYGTYHCDNLCPMFYNGTISMKECKGMLQKNALDLINRQKAEIEEKSNKLRKVLPIVAELKAEAITEFEQKVFDLFPADKNHTTISRFTIKQIAKEMKEGVNNA